MKYIIKMDVVAFDRSTAPKGEELDSAVEDALLSIDIEGCEVSEKTLRVDREVEVERDTGTPEIKALALIGYLAATEAPSAKLLDKIVQQVDKVLEEANDE